MQKFFYTQLVLLLSLAFGQAIFAQKRKVEYTADIMSGDKRISADAKRLIGNVAFRDNGTMMYCDSAYFYDATNDFDAFGRVRVLPDNGKTVLTGHLLHYRSSDRTANISGNVVLKHDDAVLKTNIIYYDLNTNVATYPNHGDIVSRDNHIVSEEGAFNRNTNQFFFKRKVVVTNPDYVIHTDTMNYHTDSKIVDFMGPTVIESTKKDSIYCERGWYNTEKSTSLFRRKAWMKGQGRVLYGDSLYYEEKTMIGKAFGNIEMRDTSQSMLLRGNYAVYNRLKKTALVSKKAVMIQFDKKDSLYLHADTIFSGVYTELTDSATNRVDTFKYVKAYYHVKFFRADLQGKCDSLYYSFKDSSLQFIRKPVLWSDNMQMKGEHVQIYTKNRKIDKMYINSSAFIISQDNDTVQFNQIKGRNIIGYFVNNQLSKMEVKGNGQFLYFAKDGPDLVGINKTESSNINMYFKSNKLSKITPINSVEGAFYPPEELKGNDLFLKDFEWFDKIRPRKWTDIFRW